MSKRMTMDEVLKEYGVPQIKLDIHATRSELLKLREKLMAIRDLSGGKEQGSISTASSTSMSTTSTAICRASSTRSARSTPSRRTSSRTGKSDGYRRHFVFLFDIKENR